MGLRLAQGQVMVQFRAGTGKGQATPGVRRVGDRRRQGSEQGLFRVTIPTGAVRPYASTDTVTATPTAR